MITISDGESLIYRGHPREARELAHLHIAAIRRFQQGNGFPVTFLGLIEGDDGEPAGQTSVWFHPGMNLIVDYGQAGPVLIDESKVDANLKAMDSDLGVVLQSWPPEDGELRKPTTVVAS
ncbi:DUF7882 family protein [Mycobacteroides abscessus]